MDIFIWGEQDVFWYIAFHDNFCTAIPYFRERLQFPAGRLGNIRIVNDDNGIVFFHLLFYETEVIVHDEFPIP